MSETNKPENIGLLGGTFNPPHWGHIGLGQTVLAHFPIDSVRYILSAKPPHKSGPQIAEPGLRFSLLEMALSPFAGLYADRSELDRKDPSWTVNTIGQLQARYPEQSFYFICGSEAFLAIQTWHRYSTLLDMIGFLVYLRTPEHQSGLLRLCERESIHMHQNPPTLPAPRQITLFTAAAHTIAISSTDIRNRIRTGQPYEHLLPDPIVKAIKENKLYA